VRKDSGNLRDRINASPAKLVADGTAATIMAKYGLTWSPPELTEQPAKTSH